MTRNKLLILIFGLLILCTGISGSYAYFKVSSEDNNANINVTVTGPDTCVTVSLSNLTSINIANEYAVPVSDAKALSGTVYRSSFDIENSCDSAQTVSLILVPSETSTMPMGALKYAFADPTVPSSGTLFSNPISLHADIVKEMASKGAGTVSQGFVITSKTIAASSSESDYIYIWIDEDEGNLARNITMNKVFNGYLTLSTNASQGTSASLATITNVGSSAGEITATISKGTFDVESYAFAKSDNKEELSWLDAPDASGGQVSFSYFCDSGDYYVYAKDVNGNVTKSSSVSVTVNNTLGRQLICKDSSYNKVHLKGIPDFNMVSTTQDGLYATQDDLGWAYYYRGAADNNWIKFGQENGADIWWRIIRTNGDGSLRIMYTGKTAPTQATKNFITGSNVTTIGTAKVSNTDKNAKYISLQYIENNGHGYGKCTTSGAASCTVDGTTVNNSPVKQKIETWWDTTNLSTLYTNGQIADAIYCNDRVAYTSATSNVLANGYGTTAHIYNAYRRLYTNKEPSLICENAGDKFTETTALGNGALLYPAGLITADEAAFAGARYSTNNTQYYLYNNGNFYTMTPFQNTTSASRQFSIQSNGRLYYVVVTTGYYLRPVISLSSSLTLSGSGTWDDPYTVS